MDEMMQKINQYPNGTFLKVTWEYGDTIIEGMLDTIYETDNGLDIDEKGYQEFYACTIFIRKIINNLRRKKIEINQLIELSKNSQPTSIELEDGTIVWEK